MVAQEQIKADAANARKQAVSEAVSLKETIFNAASNAAIDASDVDTLRAQLATIMDSHKLDPWFARDVISATTAKLANTSSKAVALVEPATIAALNAAKPVREPKPATALREATADDIGSSRVFYRHNPNNGRYIRYNADNVFIVNAEGVRAVTVKNATNGNESLRSDNLAGWYTN